MKRFLSVRELTLYAFLGAGLFAAKLAMAQLPNIEPVTLLVMLFAVCFGWKSLCAVAVYAALEFFLWGAGLWAVCYLYIWLVPFLLARAARRVDSPLWWAALSGAFGLLFGALCAPVYWGRRRLGGGSFLVGGRAFPWTFSTGRATFSWRWCCSGPCDGGSAPWPGATGLPGAA